MHLHSDVIELAAAVGQSLLLRIRCKRTRILLYIYMNSCMNIHTNAHYVQATTLCVTFVSLCFVSGSFCLSVSLFLCLSFSLRFRLNPTCILLHVHHVCVRVHVVCASARTRARVCIHEFICKHTHKRTLRTCMYPSIHRKRFLK